MQITINLEKMQLTSKDENKHSNSKVKNKYEIEIKITCQEITRLNDESNTNIDKINRIHMRSHIQQSQTHIQNDDLIENHI